MSDKRISLEMERWSYI